VRVVLSDQTLLADSLEAAEVDAEEEYFHFWVVWTLLVLQVSVMLVHMVSG
jgi:hypothetical protein